MRSCYSYLFGLMTFFNNLRKEKKVTFRVIVIGLFVGLNVSVFSAPAFASCGTIPAAPSILQENSIKADQLATVWSSLEAYLQQVDAYKTCLSDTLSALDVPDIAEGQTPDEALASPEFLAYDAQVLQISKAIKKAEEAIVAQVNRYNQLSDTTN